MQRLVPALAALGILVFTSEPADACSPACTVPKLAPALGATVPASAPGLLFMGNAAEESSAQLVDSNGTAVPGAFLADSASGRKYFAPSNALTPGTYATRSLKSCGSAETVDATFTVTASVALPTATGMLFVKEKGRASLTSVTSSGSCTEPVDAGYLDLDVSIDNALAPYLSVVTWQTKVDGNWWSQHDPIEVSAAPRGNARSYLRLFTACDGVKTTGRDNGLALGKHTVEVRAFLPGLAALSPATLVVDVDCEGDDDAIVGDGEIAGQGSGRGESGSDWDPSGSSGSGSGRFSSSGFTTPGARSQDGCSATPQMSTTGTSIIGAIVALLALAGLRRRNGALD